MNKPRCKDPDEDNTGFRCEALSLLNTLSSLSIDLSCWEFPYEGPHLRSVCYLYWSVSESLLGALLPQRTYGGDQMAVTLTSQLSLSPFLHL